ncbi:uncharacterized protein [Malus domestica]|uniref:uncharacterized protein n=1 Tax=Malus domestica TaxID=3750 RepID=UPI003974BA5D
MLALLKSNLVWAQTQMKNQADKHRTEREFTVGDWVFLRLIPYQLQSLNSHTFHKLHPKFYGPFEVVERMGKVAYKLKLPEGTKIHHVFHVSCLKKKVGSQIIPMAALPEQVTAGLEVKKPQEVLQRRIYKKGDVAGVQVLVLWEGCRTRKLPGRTMMNSLPDFPTLFFKP